jgi:hypothetical protein
LLCRPGWPWARDPPASASQVLELQACVTTPVVYIISTITLYQLPCLIVMKTEWGRQHGEKPSLCFLVFLFGAVPCI